MPSASKQAILAKSRKRQSRGRLYLVLAIVLIAIIGVGVYAYATSQPQPTFLYAKLNTSAGLIEFKLFQSQTPKTVANFVRLAQSGFYNNVTWHRIASNPAVIQTGDPFSRNGLNRTGWGQGQSSPTIPLELDPSLHNAAGFVGMARQQALDSGSCQFYVNWADNLGLDTSGGGYAVFAQVISGMSVVSTIAHSPVTSQYGPADEPVTPTFLTSVTISSTP